MRLDIKVIPKASRRRVLEDNGRLKVYLTSAPDKGKANRELIEILSKKYGVAKSRISIIAGAASRTKVVEVSEDG